jgi:hypothetical protein
MGRFGSPIFCERVKPSMVITVNVPSVIEIVLRSIEPMFKLKESPFRSWFKRITPDEELSNLTVCAEKAYPFKIRMINTGKHNLRNNVFKISSFKTPQ